MIRKQYQYKIYSKEGEFITTWNDVVNEPDFTVVINGGGVELVVQLARKTSSFGEIEDVAFGNEIQLWCYDNDAVEGVKIFSGFISRYDPITSGHEERVVVYALGYHTQLRDYLYENAQGTTELPHFSKDPGKIAEEILDAIANNGSIITWDEQTLQKTGTVVSYTFQTNTGQESVDKVLELSPTGWYWYVDADHKFHLHPRSLAVQHKFTFGKEVFYIQPQKRIENVINRVYFTGGIPDGSTEALYGRYERQGSIQQYGFKSVKKTDQRVKLQSTMDVMANTMLDNNESVELRNIIRVRDNNISNRDDGYDIESIKVGDVCNIRNYANSTKSSNWDVMQWDDGYWDFDVRNMAELDMQIVEIRYTPGYAELLLSSRLPNVSKRIEDIERNLETTTAENNPASPFLG